MAHRFSIEARNFHGSALKKSAKEKFRRKVIPLSIGRPTDELYPWASFTFEESFKDLQQTINNVSHPEANSGARKIVKRGGDFDLATGLNYSHSVGQQPLLRFITEHVEIIHNPPYRDWSVSLTCGSTSAFEIALRIFCNRGDTILTEGYTYPGLLSTALLLGLHTLGVGMDDDGLIPEDLAAILRGWDGSKGQRPSVLYTIPSGQNPTGVTQSLKRKNDICRIAEEFDLVIIEDDPYYFLQIEHDSDQVQNPLCDRQAASPTAAVYLSNLPPTFLSLDTSGRVVRLDSTSKILAPGLRGGWITSSLEIIDKFNSYQEVGPVAMAGPTQLMIWSLLDASWGHRGFMTWLASLSVHYRTRLESVLHACSQYLPANICQWSRPRNGMFLWIHLATKEHPIFRSQEWANLEEPKIRLTIDDIESRIWSKACEEGVQVTKGSLFRATTSPTLALSFRLTYAAAAEMELKEGVKSFANAIRREFELPQFR
jgi:aromatic amino acid aminotransferase I